MTLSGNIHILESLDRGHNSNYDVIRGETLHFERDTFTRRKFEIVVTTIEMNLCHR